MNVAFLWVAAGGAIGAVARYGVVQWAVSRWGAAFPWGTFAANLTGSLAIGFLAAILSSRGSDPHLRLFVITGVLGGYTTFSAFSFETLALLFAQRWAAAIAYVVGTVTLGLAAASLGYALALVVSR